MKVKKKYIYHIEKGKVIFPPSRIKINVYTNIINTGGIPSMVIIRKTNTHTYTCIHAHTHTRMCVCVCVKNKISLKCQLFFVEMKKCTGAIVIVYNIFLKWKSDCI